MEENNTYQISDFITELSSVSLNDILLHLTGEMKSVFVLENQNEASFEVFLDSKLTQILKLSEKYKKVSDISSLCLSSNILNWKFKDKEIATPIFLTGIDAKINRINKTVRFSREKYEFILNPFLINIFRKEFDIGIDFRFDDLDEALEKLRSIFDENNLTYTISDFDCLGNFHHHRFEVLKDLEEIENSKIKHPLVHTLMGNPSTDELDKYEFTDKSCFSTDTDQELIFKELETQNLVVQGPPGTGKSQILVNLISKLLISEKSHLVVSEKRSALDVLCKKLNHFQLDKFCFVFSSDKSASEFISHIKTTWNFLENETLEDKRNVLLSNLKIDNLEYIKNKMNSLPLFRFYKLSELQLLIETKEYQNVPFLANLPSIVNWQNDKHIFQNIYSKKYDLSCLNKLKFDFFKKVEDPKLFLSKLNSNLVYLKEIYTFSSYEDLEKLYKTTLRLQIFESESSKVYFDLIKSNKKSISSIYKKFKKLKSEFERVNENISILKNEQNNWKRTLSLSEIQSLKSGIKSSSIIKKFRTQKKIKQLFSLNVLEPIESLNNLEKLIQFQFELVKIKKDFEKIGFTGNLNNLNVIDYVMNKISSLDDNELNAITKLSNQEYNLFVENSISIQTLYKDISMSLKLESNESLEIAFESLLNENLLEIKEVLGEIDREKFQSLAQFKSLDELELAVVKSEWIKVSSLFPNLQDFSSDKLLQILQEIESLEKNEFQQYSEEIKFKLEKRFEKAHQLLQTSSVKLNSEQKELKRKLKSGKAILVREFAKSRQHKSLRELMSSHAVVWLGILNPIHLSTPLAVSRNYPLKSDLFEFVIFDEASQIVLPKAISCVFRAKRMIVCGDSQQMSPSSFFKGKINSVDLLHQVKYYLPNFSLSHHYRSIHPELIAFSNKYFYDNRLIVFPSPNDSESIIELHQVKNGIFHERQNKVEAKEIATFLTMNVNSQKTIGVVAFSEQQLSCIWKCLDVSIQLKFEEKIKSRKLFFRTLEQVQGDECDHLIVSIGYGYDENNKFQMRFGPLNQESGSKRLNVLFSRAKEKIDLFSSISSSDLQLSTNEAVNLLKAYLYKAEQKVESKKSILLPFELDFTRKGNEIIIKNVFEKLTSAKELTTFHQVMSSRGWNVSFEV